MPAPHGQEAGFDHIKKQRSSVFLRQTVIHPLQKNEHYQEKNIVLVHSHETRHVFVFQRRKIRENMRCHDGSFL